VHTRQHPCIAPDVGGRRQRSVEL